MTEADELLDKLQERTGGPLRTWEVYLSKQSYLKIKIVKHPNRYVVYWESWGSEGKRRTFEDPFELFEYLVEHVHGASDILAEPIK
jgi:hypothetical protein